MRTWYRCAAAAALSLLAACGTVMDWQEVRSGPASQAEVYDAVVAMARTDGFAPSGECDRGLGVWQSRWRSRQIGLGRPGRFRLRAELLLDRGSAAHGWTVRYRIEQQKVKDLVKSQNPAEEDWSPDGVDSEKEYLFGERLRRRLTKPATAPSHR